MYVYIYTYTYISNEKRNFRKAIIISEIDVIKIKLQGLFQTLK